MDNELVLEAIGAAGMAVLVLDETDHIIDCDPSAARMLGHDPGDLTGLPLSAFVVLVPPTAAGVGTGTRAVEYAAANLTMRYHDERPLVVVVRLARWVDQSGAARATVLLCDSAIELEVDRNRQKQLMQSDNAIRATNIGVFEFDPNTETVSVSPIWRQLLELEPGENIDLQVEWRGRVHPDDLDAALEPIRLCTEDLVKRASCEYRLHSRDRRRWRWMRTDIAIAQRDAAGKPSLLVGAQTDITLRKTTEDALRMSVEQFRSAFENAPVGMAIVGRDGGWRKANAALCNLLGYSEEELLRTNFQSLTHPDDLEADLSQLRLLTRGAIPSYTLEKRYIRANGAVMWGKLSVGMVRNAEGRPDHFVVQVIDVTEQRRLNQMKSEFVSVVSHELRTPLTSILGALTLLETYDDSPFPDEVQRLLYIAKTNGDRLNHLINDILDFQKFSAREMRFTLAPHRIGGLIDTTLLANVALADKNNVRFGTSSLDRAPVAMVDPKRFHQVMANLLSNATKFADPGSVVEVGAELQGGVIRVSVSNTGPGIPEAFQDRIFKPFSQASSMTDLRSGGTGLGLSITKQIVEQMGGEIGFESTPGGLTTFWFTIRAGDAGE